MQIYWYIKGRLLKCPPAKWDDSVVPVSKEHAVSPPSGNCAIAGLVLALLIIFSCSFSWQPVLADDLSTQDLATSVSCPDGAIKSQPLTTAADKTLANEPAAKFLSVPILYMTDRELQRTNHFGENRKPESESIYDVYCGNLQYPILNTDKKGLSDSRIALGWSGLRKHAASSTVLLNHGAKPSDSLDRFADKIAELARTSGQKELFVFVHGFNTSFDCAAKSAALLAYETERPVILFSWPSTDRVFQYFVDAGNNEWSQEHFNRFLEKLYEIKEKDGISINVVAHSMGNRLVIRSAPVLANKRVFDKVFLVDPDLDSQTFLHYVARYVNKTEQETCGKLSILFSHKDNALPLAQMLFGGYTRLGQGADTIVESLFKPKQMMPAFLRGTRTVLGLNAVQLADNKSGARHNLFKKELSWIDFTALDHGLIGHSIPYKLIANLSANSTPGPGLALLPVEISLSNHKRKTVNRCLESKKDAEPFGVCQRVVFSKDLMKDTPLADSEAAPILIQ